MKNTRDALILCAAFCAFIPHSATAGSGISKPAKALNKQMVEDFVYRTAEVSNGQDEYMNTDEMVSFLDKHIDKKAVFTTDMHFQMPGMPPQNNQIRIGKTHFLAGVKQGDENVSSYKSDLEIKSSWRATIDVWTWGILRN